jgi:hypothetical protein
VPIVPVPIVPVPITATRSIPCSGIAVAPLSLSGRYCRAAIVEPSGRAAGSTGRLGLAILARRCRAQ